MGCKRSNEWLIMGATWWTFDRNEGIENGCSVTLIKRGVQRVVQVPKYVNQGDQGDWVSKKRCIMWVRIGSFDSTFWWRKFLGGKYGSEIGKKGI